MTSSKVVFGNVARAVVGLGLVLVVGSCADGDGLTGLAPVGAVAVAPDSLTLLLGETGTFTAEVLDTKDRPLEGREVRWAVTDTAVAQIDSLTGFVRTRAVGTTEVTATSGGVRGRARLVVAPVPVASVAVTPDSTDVRVGNTVQLAAATLDSVGGTLAGRPVTWASADPAVATVTGAGLVTGMGAGKTTVTATSEGKTGSAVVVVTPRPVGSVVITPDSAEARVGYTVAFTASVLDSTGALLPGRTITWSSAAPAVASVDPSTGVVTGVAAGLTTITATSEGVSDAAIVSVSLPPVDSVLVAPDSAEARVGGTVTFTASVFDSAGATLTGRTIAWSSADPTIASVDPNTGVVTGEAVGVTTVTATSEGVSDAAIVSVSLRPVDSVLVAPDSAAVAVYATVTFTATVYDSAGAALTGRTVTWSSADPTVASVDPSTGVVTGEAVGVTTITATSEGVSDAAIVAVLPPPVASVQVAPDSAEARVGYTVTFSATVFDQANQPLPGRTVTWSSANPTVASVDPNTGVVTGEAVGVTTITATSEGITDDAIVSVSAAPVDSVLVAPDSAEARVDYTVAFTASVYDSAGAALTGRTITWSSADPTIASVDPGTGVVTGEAVGVTTITATSEGVSDAAIVSVSLPPVASVTVNPASAEVRVGYDLDVCVFTQCTGPALTAQAFDSAGSELAGRSVTWTSLDPAVATVGASPPRVTGVAVGTTGIVATVEGIADTLALTVSLPPVAGVTITPATSNIPIGGGDSLTVELVDSAGAVLTGRTVTWSSLNPSGATVDAATGVVRGVAVVATGIVATSEGVADTAAISVAPGIVFASSLTAEGMGIWVMNVDGSARWQLAAGSASTELSWPAYSPDGTRIVFQRDPDKGGPDPADVFVMDADGSNVSQLTTGTGANVHPQFSPDGTQIAFASDRDGNFELYRMNADGSAQTRLTNNAASDQQPTYSPDGTHLAFVSNRDAGDREIYLLDLVNLNQIRLTGSVGDDSDPHFSPDGAKIAFTSARTGSGQVWVMDADGANPQALTSGTGLNSNGIPRWSRDGARIVFVSLRDANFELYVMNADGSAQTRLTTNSPGQDDQPWWNTNGFTVPPKVTSVAVTPAGPLTLTSLGDTVHLTAEALNGVKNPIAGKTFTWTSSQPTVASVGTDGVVTALANGTTTITASTDGVTSNAVSVTVAQAVASVTVSPGPSYGLRPGGAVTFTAAAFDAGGSPVAGAPAATWASSNTGAATINPTTGQAAAVALGTTTITATVAGVDGTAALTVSSQKIAFHRDASGLKVYVAEVDGTGATELAPGYFPRFSGDGNRIVFQNGSGNGSEIYVVNTDGTGLQQLTSDAAGSEHPSFSPDGTKIAFSRLVGGDREVYVMNADGTGLTRLTNSTGGDTEPTFSPDGTKIVFTSTRDGDKDVWVMNADGSNPQQAGDVANIQSVPKFSPDGLKIAMESSESGGFRVWISDVDGTNRVQPWTTTTQHGGPVFSLDGTKLFFHISSGGIRRMDLPGGANITEITTGNDFHPVVQPLGPPGS